MINILVVDDNESFRSLITHYLQEEGYQVFPSDNGADALDMVEKIKTHLIITEYLLPGMNGYSLIEHLRKLNHNMPVIIISYQEGIEHKKIGFEAGADDYMTKPINLMEMLLRVKALLRRARISCKKRLVYKNITLDYDTLSVITPKEIIEFPKKEFYLLFKLLSYPKKIFTRQQLMDELWGMDTEVDVRTIDVHIKRIREKLKHINAFHIITIRGLGYKASID